MGSNRAKPLGKCRKNHRLRVCEQQDLGLMTLDIPVEAEKRKV